ncbi:MAG: HAMP domain-containing sensor histidine kinase [Bacteroidota bacterium]
MRLVTKILLIYLGITLVVFLIGGWVTFTVIQRTVDEEQGRHLREQLEQLITSLEAGVPASNLENDRVDITLLGTDSVQEAYSFADTVLIHPWLKRPETYTLLNATRRVDSLYYAFSMYDLMVEPDDIADGVRESLLKTYLILFGGVLVVTLLLSAWLFRPFNRLLENIRGFKLGANTPLSLPPTGTREFRRLNDFLGRMTEKSRQDYQRLKEFSDNASHEMQTPLAVARGKLELLLNSPNLKDEDLQLIQSAQQSVQTLSKLGSSLALLTKIGNEEFSDIQPVDLSTRLTDKLFDLEELIELKDLKLSHTIAPGVQVSLDPVLVEVLLTNLLQNAIRHNVQSGQIEVHLAAGALTVRNTGEAPSVEDPQQLFGRFKKDAQSSSSLGLGLAIVKQIVDRQGWVIDYTYADGWHVLTLFFS